MSTTLDPHITRYLASRVALGTYTAESTRTVGPRLRSLGDHFGRRPVDRLSRRAVEAWLESLAHLAPNSRGAYLASARTFCRWLVEQGHVPVDPTADIPRPRRTRTVPRAQTADAVAAILDACADDRERCVVWLMVGLGLRRGEVARARWDDYDERAQLLLVHGKGGHERILPVTPEVARALQAVRGHAAGPVIRSKVDETAPVQPATVGKWVGDLMRRARVKRAAWDGVSGHALRHTAASDVLDECGDLTVVQEMLGHEALSTTAIYLRRASAQRMRAAMGGRTYRSGRGGTPPLSVIDSKVPPEPCVERGRAA